MGLLALAKKNPALAIIIDVFDWYPSHYPAEERKLLRKLDLSILIFGSLSFFCRFLGQQNITNAYVSGMKEDLKAYGNELNYYDVSYTTAYVVGQIPLMTLQTKPKLAAHLLPALNIIWAIIAFCQSTVTKSWHLYICRVITGFLEASSFGGTHLIIGSWFKNEEVFKRAGVWFMGNSLGSMFSGYLQAAIYQNLNGVGGRAGWQWLFIVQGIITLPVAFIGFVTWPGLPASPKRWFFTEDEYQRASTRIRVVEKEGITWSTFKYTLGRPMWWICVPCYVCMIQAHYWTGYMALWLRAAGYSITLVNVLPTFIDLLRALCSWLGTTLAGSVSIRGLWTFQAVPSLFGVIVLAVWAVPGPLKFLAFYFGGFTGMASPILYSWVNTTLKENYGERGLIISSMMTFGYAFKIWVPLFTFPTVEAPRYPHGYPASIAFQVAMWGLLMFGVWFMKRWKLRHPDLEMRIAAGEEDVSQEGSSEDLGAGHAGGKDVTAKNVSVVQTTQ